jgi:hypothetical protein
VVLLLLVELLVLDLEPVAQGVEQRELLLRAGTAGLGVGRGGGGVVVFEAVAGAGDGGFRRGFHTVFTSG